MSAILAPVARSAGGVPRRRTELGLLLLSALTTAFAFLLSHAAITGHLLGSSDTLLAVVALLPLAGHLANRRWAPDSDAVLLPTAALLNGLGWVMVVRLDRALALHQALWTAIGILLYVVTLAVVRHSRDMERYRYLLGIGGVGMLLLPLVPHLGVDINGSRLWVRLGPISFQPIEVAKIALVIFFASYFGEKRDLISTPTMRVGNLLLPDPRVAGPLVAAWGFAMLAMVVEHNVGFAFLIFVMFLSMLWVASGRVAYLLVGAVLFVIGTVVGSLLFAHVDARMIAWLHPWSHVNTVGYQIVQAQYALGWGGVTGTGLGLGHPGYVPVVVSDFIFAAFGEEMGLIGTTALVIAFLVIVGAGLRAALAARSDFSKLTAAGLTAVLGFQAFFIMAGIVRLLPLTGVTLPFVAYGGSSLVANYVLLALLGRISNEGEAQRLGWG